MNEKFKNLLENAPTSAWKEEFEYRRDNKYWLDISVSVAVSILREIRQKKITKTKLREDLGYTKERMSEILKGKANLTIKEIKDIERVLNIELIVWK